MSLVTLRVMCESLHISRRSIQCYEKAGLLMPTGKNKYGYLLYDEEAVRRAERIRFLQQMGFKLKEVKEVIDAPDEVLKSALEQQIKVLEEEILRLQILIREAEHRIEGL